MAQFSIIAKLLPLVTFSPVTKDDYTKGITGNNYLCCTFFLYTDYDLESVGTCA